MCVTRPTSLTFVIEHVRERTVAKCNDQILFRHFIKVSSGNKILGRFERSWFLDTTEN